MQPHIYFFQLKTFLTNVDKSMHCCGWCCCQNVFQLVASCALRIRKENSFHSCSWYLFENFIHICSKLTLVFPMLTIQYAFCCSSLLLVVRDNEGKILKFRSLFKILPISTTRLHHLGFQHSFAAFSHCLKVIQSTFYEDKIHPPCW